MFSFSFFHLVAFEINAKNVSGLKMIPLACVFVVSKLILNQLALNWMEMTYFKFHICMN